MDNSAKKCEQCGGELRGNQGRFCSRPCWYEWKALRPVPLEVRFWKHVDKQGPDECWPWTGASSQYGYGHINSGPKPNRRLIASRVSYEIANGPIPAGAHVLHSCDNPPCVNPAHLSIGSPRDNSDDKITKQRHARGATHGGARLSESDVEAIRALSAAGQTGRYIANLLGTSEGWVSMIINNKGRRTP